MDMKLWLNKIRRTFGNTLVKRPRAFDKDWLRKTNELTMYRYVEPVRDLGAALGIFLFIIYVWSI